ncbi:hypothetical protein TRFO_11451 [Tritrichomonas foetus]|uniref:Myb-like DNA-binding domain containing protein n=1 Tax=Tritrichomonas foetus TaxID=1144522 RepID=A0A1J4J3H5_9EUKA|nr:hypothetical protein TRFO_11451 [Tritrichomonas foetus]|eukprot:OHS93974.1 hypothetical protein TRFO_11451 [Tritrichomonas foetus]
MQSILPSSHFNPALYISNEIKSTSYSNHSPNNKSASLLKNQQIDTKKIPFTNTNINTNKSGISMNNINSINQKNLMNNGNPINACHLLIQQQRSTKKHSRKAFSPEEDALIANFVNINGATKWDIVASFLPGRNARQCRERWRSSLSPGLTNGPWTKEEDKLLVKLHSQFGPKWSQISKYFVGRSDYNVKNRWQRFQRYGDLYKITEIASSDEGESLNKFENKNNNEAQMKTSDDQIHKFVISKNENQNEKTDNFENCGKYDIDDIINSDFDDGKVSFDITSEYAMLSENYLTYDSEHINDIFSPV